MWNLTIWQFERDNEEPNRQTAAGTERLLSVVSTCASKKRIWNIVPPPNMTWFLCKSCVPFAPCSADRERHVERLHSINTYTVRAYQYPASNAQFSFNWYWCAVPRQRGYGITIWLHASISSICYIPGILIHTTLTLLHTSGSRTIPPPQAWPINSRRICVF